MGPDGLKLGICERADICCSVGPYEGSKDGKFDGTLNGISLGLEVGTALGYSD